VKAVVIKEYGGPEVLKVAESPMPEAGPGEILVKVRAAGLNRADLLQRSGLYPQPGPKHDDEIPGLEFAGEVAALGQGTEGFVAGDRVMGILAGRGHAEYLTTHASLAVKVPTNLSWTQAAAVPEAFITANDGLEQCRTAEGETVLVHAVGSGVGLAAVQVARLYGAHTVIGTARSADKLERADQFKLDATINSQQEDFAERVAELTAQKGADVILDLVGATFLEQNIKAAALKGRIVTIGLVGGLRAELNLGLLLAKRLELRGTVLRSRSLAEKAAATRSFSHRVLAALASGQVVPVIDSVYPMGEVSEAHKRMEANANFGKIVLEMG
jgi:putative PIG3 family NAD(P)H quinone oxidoreductase